jgi:hypothetical protein
MKLKEKGKYLELPIIGTKIKKLIYDGFLTIVFNDDEESYLGFHADLNICQYNQEKIVDLKSKECLTFLYDQFGQTITEAKADKFGVLFIEFENGTKITVEDGPYENWHYTKRSKGNKIDCLYVHGGVGRTTY